jgi:hypothetical protein
VSRPKICLQKRKGSKPMLGFAKSIKADFIGIVLVVIFSSLANTCKNKIFF